jgi:hypothetical protein
MIVREVVWLHKLLADLSEHLLDSTIIHYGNQSCVKISNNLVFHEKSKHIEIKYHYIQDMVQRKSILVQHLPIDVQVFDVLTKPLTKTKFEYFRDKTWCGRECLPR